MVLIKTLLISRIHRANHFTPTELCSTGILIDEIVIATTTNNASTSGVNHDWQMQPWKTVECSQIPSLSGVIQMHKNIAADALSLTS